MNPLKERTELTTKTITTLLTSVLVASVAGIMISMPQMIGSVYAQSERGSENACKELPGATLERGKCTAPAQETRIATCDPLFGQTPTPSSSDKCTASKTQKAGTETNAAEAACKAMPGGSAKTENTGTPGEKRVTCTYDAKITTTFTCPNDIKPTGELCITKPGDRTEEEV